MKRFNKLIALSISLLLATSSAAPCLAAAEDNSVQDDGILLNIDYDDNTKALQIVSSEPQALLRQYPGTTDSYTLFNIKNDWSQAGYELNKVIPNDGDDYKLSFDFEVDENSSGYYELMLSERATEVDEVVYHQFGVLCVTNEMDFKVAGRVLEGEKCEYGVWYHYEMIFNRKTRNIDVAISRKENPEVKATYVGNAPISGTYGNAMPDYNYDVLKLSAGGVFAMDNILLEESKDKPMLVTKVSSDHVGNIFDGSDQKTLKVTTKNVLNEDVTGKLDYVVKDANGNVVDTGNVEDITIGGRQQGNVSITVNAAKYSTYSIIFDITAKDPTTGEEKKYSSERFMFSVANKRKAGEPLNYNTATNVLYTENEQEAKDLAEIMSQSGLSAARKEISWYYIEQTPGVYQIPEHAKYYNILNDEGIEYMAIISPNSYWYAGNWDRMRVDQMEEDGVTDIWDKWEKHLEYIAKTFKGQVKYYEIYNEPNEWVTPEIYVKYLEHAQRAFKKYDPDAVVVGFSTASMPWVWIEQVLSLISTDPHKYLDAISIHPYDFDYGEYQNHSPYASASWSILFRDQVFIDKNTRLKGLLEQYNCSDIPILGTEIGMSSTPGVFSQSQQAADMMQMFTTSDVDGIIDRVWIYCLENTHTRGSDDDNLGDSEDNFGIVGNRKDTTPYAAKLAYIALCGYNKMVSGAKCLDSYVNNPTRAYRYERTDGKQVVMLWSEHSFDNIALDLGATTAEVYDQYSNHMGTINATNGAFNFTATFEPIYIVGNFSKLERKDSTISISKGRITAVTKDVCTFDINDKLGRNLRIDAVSTPYAPITEVKNVTSGKGKIVAVTKEDAYQEEPIDISIYDAQDKLVYFSRAHIVMSETGGISVKYNLGGAQVENGRPLINVSVTNKTAGTTLTGDVVADYSIVGGKTENRKIVNLKPGETKTVYMNIPKSSYIHSIGAPLHIDFGEGFKIDEEMSVIDTYNVAYNNTGKKGLEVLDTDMSNMVKYAANDKKAAISIPNWGGPSDCGMIGTLLWDEENLYVYAEVTDNVFFQDKEGSGVWEADGLQMGIQDSSKTTPGDTAFTEIGISKTKNGNELWRFSNQNGCSNTCGYMENCQVDIKVTAGKTIYKCVFPWKELTGKDTYEAGDELRFNISANENDGGGRRGWVELTEGICGTKNAQLFANIKLNK